jgi:hypothetical protein
MEGVASVHCIDMGAAYAYQHLSHLAFPRGLFGRPFVGVDTTLAFLALAHYWIFSACEEYLYAFLM